MVLHRPALPSATRSESLHSVILQISLNGLLAEVHPYSSSKAVIAPGQEHMQVCYSQLDGYLEENRNVEISGNVPLCFMLACQIRSFFP